MMMYIIGITDDLEDVEFTITYQRDAEIIKESEFHFEFCKLPVAILQIQGSFH